MDRPASDDNKLEFVEACLFWKLVSDGSKLGLERSDSDSRKLRFGEAYFS